MRLIDADALMADLEKWLTQIDPTHPPEDNAIPPMEDIIVSTLMTIEEQQTIEPPKWIPVTEALPEDCVAVWVTIRGHDVIRCEGDETLEQAIDRVRKMVRVEGGFYVADEKSWYNENGFPMMVQPVAWMPMEVPAPWRGQDETRGVSETP